MMKTKRDGMELPGVGDTFKAGNGTTYVVENLETPETHRAAGRPRVAENMERLGILADISCRRPKGRVLNYVFARKTEDGIFFQWLMSFGRL